MHSAEEIAKLQQATSELWKPGSLWQLTPYSIIGLLASTGPPLYFVLKQDGTTLSGSGGPNASEQHPFEKARIDGDKIVLEVAVGEKGTIHFELKADGDGLKGTVELRRADGTESGTVIVKKAT